MNYPKKSNWVLSIEYVAQYTNTRLYQRRVKTAQYFSWEWLTVEVVSGRGGSTCPDEYRVFQGTRIRRGQDQCRRQRVGASHDRNFGCIQIYSPEACLSPRPVSSTSRHHEPAAHHLQSLVHGWTCRNCCWFPGCQDQAWCRRAGPPWDICPSWRNRCHTCKGV